MLDLPVIPQSGPGLCGPASLCMVLGYYGRAVSQGQLAAQMGTVAGADGTPGRRIVAAARRLGYRAALRDRARVEELARLVCRKRMPIIVNWFACDDGHYSVVVDVEPRAGLITLADPEGGRLRVLPLKSFLRCWFDFDGERAAPGRMIYQRMILVAPAAPPRLASAA